MLGVGWIKVGFFEDVRQTNKGARFVVLLAQVSSVSTDEGVGKLAKPIDTKVMSVVSGNTIHFYF